MGSSKTMAGLLVLLVAQGLSWQARAEVRSFSSGFPDVSAPDATEALIMAQVPAEGFIDTDIVIAIRGDRQMNHLIRLAERDGDTAPFVERFAGRFIDSGGNDPERKVEYHFESGMTLAPGKQVWLWNLPLLTHVTVSGYVPKSDRQKSGGPAISSYGFALKCGILPSGAWRVWRRPNTLGE